MTSDEFRRIRRALHLTQVEMSRALGVSQGAVSRWEKGTRPISEHTAKFLHLLADQAQHSRRPRRRGR
jgi:DNA-binding transcriptional regulator YiaG